MEKGHEEEGKKCCHGYGGGKVVAAIVLILLGWIVGYMMGSGGMCHKNKGMCDHKGGAAMADCPMMGDKAPAPK